MLLSALLGAVVGYFVLPVLLWRSPGLAKRKPVAHSVWVRVLQPLLFVLLGFSFFPLAHVVHPFLEPLIVCMVSGFVLVNCRSRTEHERFQGIEDFWPKVSTWYVSIQSLCRVRIGTAPMHKHRYHKNHNRHSSL